MKTVIVVAMLLFAASMAGAQEKSVQVASDKFEAFHEAMHPAWHDAYPAKDYAALIAFGPKFEAAYAPIGKLELVMKNPARLSRFNLARTEMGILVTAFGDACRKGDSAKVYEIMPNLHESFEKAMGLLYPMEFKPLDGLLITVDVILDIHVPSENWDGMAGSTETILRKLGYVNDSIYPKELAPQKIDINAAFKRAGGTAEEMKMCADKKDLKCFREETLELKALLVAMRENYL